MPFGWNDCDPRIRKQAEAVASTLADFLGDSPAGVYVHGSLAFGCCNPKQSDLDILAVTERSVPTDLRLPLLRALAGISRSPLPLEMSVVVRDDLVPWRHPAPYVLHYSEEYREAIEAGRTLVPGLDPDLATHVTVTRRHGIIVVGAPPATTLPEVPWADYLDSILADFDDCIARLTHTYSVLNIARVLATLETGEVYSKESGAVWALPRLPSNLRCILESALNSYRHGTRRDFTADPLLPAYKTYVAAVVAGLR